MDSVASNITAFTKSLEIIGVPAIILCLVVAAIAFFFGHRGRQIAMGFIIGAVGGGVILGAAFAIGSTLKGNFGLTSFILPTIQGLL